MTGAPLAPPLLHVAYTDVMRPSYGGVADTKKSSANVSVHDCGESMCGVLPESATTPCAPHAA
jgi:hypothetical protein